MSTIVSFMPMNVRLYDRDERELRTYVSPEFTLVEDPFDERGMSCHIVADNGGGKSTLLLFFEMLFCKPDRSGPSVGHKRAIDYLRRARMELGDATPTSMAALVRRDDPSLMRGARDVIFGYSVGLRGSDGVGLDLRRFVIHVEENPGFTLDMLARDYIFDTKGAPRQLRDVWERLHDLPGCHLYESSEWDDYAREMIEAGVNPTLWRELARMNQDEEAAGDYFASGDAFKKIVNLVSESLEPTSGERRKPLAETAAAIARQVSTQTEDRARERALVEAAEAVNGLSEEVGAYAQAREDLRLVEDEARLVRDVLDGECRELDEIIDKLEGAAAGYRERRRQNDCLNVSATIRRRAREIEAAQEGADALERDSREKDEIARSAERAVMIEDAARTRRTYLKLEAEIRAQRDAVAVLEGKMERDEELARARGRAWAGADEVTRISNERAKAAEEALAGASKAEEEAATALDAADDRLQERMLALGQAQERAEGALSRLAELARDVEGLESAQVTLSGLYAEASLTTLRKGAEAALRERAGEHEEARSAVGAAETRLKEAQGERREAEMAVLGAEAQAQTWNKNLEMVQEQERTLRDAVALFEDVRTLVVEGRYEEAADATNTLRANLEGDARDEDEHVRAIESRLKALEEGRLDTTEGLRAWLDRHGIRAVTLGGYKGIPEAVRDTIFGVSPWLAHALVVDETALKALERASDEDGLTELGHAVFYVRQRDVAGLVEVATAGAGLPVAGDGRQLVRALGTVDATSLMDPERFKAELMTRAERARAAADQARTMAGKLLAARDLIVAFSRTLSTIGMQPGATTSDVAERARIVTQALEQARRRLDEAAAAVSLAEMILEEDRASLVRAQGALQHATRQLQATQALVEQNGRAEKAVGAREMAQGQERAARAAKRAAEAAYGNARTTRRMCAEEHDKAQRELRRVQALVARIEALGTRPTEEDLYREEAPNTAAELEQAANALDALQSRISEDLHDATNKLYALQARQGESEQWRHDIEEGKARGIVFSVEDLDACVPAERFEYQRMRRRMTDAFADRKIADNAYREALNELRVLDLQQKSSYADLAAFGLDEPLDVPEGYDFAAQAAQIDADEESDLETLATSREERDELAQLAARAGLASERANQQDGYRASRVATAPAFADMAARRVAVSSLAERQRVGLAALQKAAGGLETQGEQAKLATEEAQERQAARNIADSVRTLREDCTSKSAMMNIGVELKDRSQMLRSMALTLQNRLRATDESVGDIVEQAVEEGYKLTTELFHLSRISRASIKGSRPQRTIDFRSRGRTVFADEFRRDDVATERLKRQVRDLIMEELPALEDARRLERAEARLAPPELVYLLLDDRSVDVRYPVIRGGARLSYESTRDAAGSGSTGQKSAGYVLSFLALLRYLGNVGALSKENSLFVALENQFGKISSTSIIADIKEVVDQTHMQLITVAGRELRSSYAMGDVVYALYRTQGSESSAKRSVSAMRARRGDDEEPIHDSIIDRFRATRRFENLSFDI